MKSLILCFFFLSLPLAHADAGREVGNGGDPAVADFITLGNRVAAALDENPSLLGPGLTGRAMRQFLRRERIQVTADVRGVDCVGIPGNYCASEGDARIWIGGYVWADAYAIPSRERRQQQLQAVIHYGLVRSGMAQLGGEDAFVERVRHYIQYRDFSAQIEPFLGIWNNDTQSLELTLRQNHAGDLYLHARVREANGSQRSYQQEPYEVDRPYSLTYSPEFEELRFMTQSTNDINPTCNGGTCEPFPSILPPLIFRHRTATGSAPPYSELPSRESSTATPNRLRQLGLVIADRFRASAGRLATVGNRLLRTIQSTHMETVPSMRVTCPSDRSTETIACNYPSSRRVVFTDRAVQWTETFAALFLHEMLPVMGVPDGDYRESRRLLEELFESEFERMSSPLVGTWNLEGQPLTLEIRVGARRTVAARFASPTGDWYVNESRLLNGFSTQSWTWDPLAQTLEPRVDVSSDGDSITLDARMSKDRILIPPIFRRN